MFCLCLTLKSKHTVKLRALFTLFFKVQLVCSCCFFLRLHFFFLFFVDCLFCICGSNFWIFLESSTYSHDQIGLLSKRYHFHFFWNYTLACEFSREASNLQTEPKEVCEFLRLALNMKSIFKWSRNQPDPNPLGTRLMEWFDYRAETRVIDSTVAIEDVFNKK